ncbi:MAG: hypothetical protein K0S11_1733, partial [Gammaproteobacteria bacterium]|nr:hypothetical protein [Gammaproteobacteria bacterium]
MFGFFTPLRACLKVRLEDYPLHGPASSGNAKLLNHLLENHKKYIDTDEYQYGMTPLHSALYNYHYVSMTVLLDHGAYHSPRVEGARNWTPLHTAIHEDDYTAIRLLLVYGASLKVKDKHGHTPEFYITNRIEFNNDHKPSLKSVNKPVLQSMISETCTIKKTFDTYNHKL